MDLSNLKSFMANDAWILVSALMVIFGFKPWKEQQWMKLGGIIGGGTILIIILKGATFIDFFKGILKFFGINV